jgi:hypothetical protein
LLYVATVFLSRGLITFIGPEEWVLALRSKMAEWHHPNLPESPARDRGIFDTFVRHATERLNQYWSFRPVGHFALPSSSGSRDWDGLDPMQYDWQEYERRGLLKPSTKEYYKSDNY